MNSVLESAFQQCENVVEVDFLTTGTKIGSVHVEIHTFDIKQKSELLLARVTGKGAASSLVLNHLQWLDHK